jgi:hypothetical protein
MISGLAVAQGPPQNVPMNVVYVGADGKFESAPDTAVLQFNVAAQDNKSRAAYDKASRTVEQVREVLNANGIDTKAAEIGFYAVQPMYDWSNAKHKVIGYRVVTSVTLKLHDFSKIGALTEQTADIENMANQSLNYILENVDAAKVKATEDALRKARTQAQAVAVTGGRTLGELLYASVDVTQQPVPLAIATRVAMKAEANEYAPPTEGFTPRGITINAHVNAMFGLK